MLGKSWRAAAAGCAVALVLAGCGGDDVAAPAPVSGSAPSTTSPSPSPTAASPTPSPSDSAGETTARAVYYVRDVPPAGPRLYREFHARPAGAEPVRDAVEAMLTEPPRDPDYTSLWPSGVEVRDVQVEGDLATVDLSARAAEGSAGAAFEAASVQQLVHVVTAADPSVSRVQLLVEGQPRESLWGHVDISQPVERRPQEEILGPVWVIEPGEGGSVAQGGQVTGVATVFEATVNWEWVQDGQVVRSGFSTATEGAPGRGEWTAPVEVPPGDYEFRAFESSAQDGQPMFVETKDVTVTE